MSVIVPCYQQPEALALTLAGLETQRFPRWMFEVVVVDDGSTPPIEESVRARLDDWLGQEPRVRVAPGVPVLDAFPASPFHVQAPVSRKTGVCKAPWWRACAGRSAMASARG